MRRVHMVHKIFLTLALLVCDCITLGPPSDQSPAMSPDMCDSWSSESDESDGTQVGGTLYTYDHRTGDVSGWDRPIDLAVAGIQAGFLPRVKPHMVLPNPDGTKVAIPYTGDTAVHIMDTSTKEIVQELDASKPRDGVVGGKMHTGSWLDTTSFAIVDMTGTVDGFEGGALHVYRDGDYVDSVAMGTPAIMTDRGTSATKPIAMGNNPAGRSKDRFFVTDAKGSGSIVDLKSHQVLHSFPVRDFAGCNSGGLWVVPHPGDDDLVVAQYGSQQRDSSEEPAGGMKNDGSSTQQSAGDCLVMINMTSMQVVAAVPLSNTAIHTPQQALTVDVEDAHGIQFCTSSAGLHHLINTNRISGTLDVLSLANLDTSIDEPELEIFSTVLTGFDLNSALKDAGIIGTADVLQPDISYFVNGRLFIAGRGNQTLSAVQPENRLRTARSGLYSFSLEDCAAPKFVYGDDVMLLADWTRTLNGYPDMHGIWGVGNQIWAIDQAPTKSLKQAMTEVCGESEQEDQSPPSPASLCPTTNVDHGAVNVVSFYNDNSLSDIQKTACNCDRVENSLVIDVRPESQQTERGKLACAETISLSDFSNQPEDAFQALDRALQIRFSEEYVEHGINSNLPISTYCNSGYWAQQAADIIRDEGYNNVVNLGGYCHVYACVAEYASCDHTSGTAGRAYTQYGNCCAVSGTVCGFTGCNETQDCPNS